MATVVDVLPLARGDCTAERVMQYFAVSNHELARNIVDIGSWVSSTGIQHFLVQFTSDVHATEARKLSSRKFWVSPTPEALQFGHCSAPCTSSPPIGFTHPLSYLTTSLTRSVGIPARHSQVQDYFKPLKQSTFALPFPGVVSIEQQRHPPENTSGSTSTTTPLQVEDETDATEDLHATSEDLPQSDPTIQIHEGDTLPVNAVSTLTSKATSVQAPSPTDPTPSIPSAQQVIQEAFDKLTSRTALLRSALCKTLDAFGLDATEVVQVDKAMQQGDTTILEELLLRKKEETDNLRKRLEEETTKRIEAEQERARYQKEKAEIEVQVQLFLPAMKKAREILQDVVGKAGNGNK